MHQAQIIADSMSPDGVRITSIVATYPRIIHAEVMTHRVFSRNAASSRAIPIEKMLQKVEEDPYVPTEWGANQKGMQAGELLTGAAAEKARSNWLIARDHAVTQARALLDTGVHKQLTNRLLEPFLWYTCLITATEWDNFFNLRCHPDAHPEIRKIAELMREEMRSHCPRQLEYGQWHLPFVDFDRDSEALGLDPHKQAEEAREALKGISSGRSARISYETHDGVRDVSKDVELHDRLLASGHMSPFEHPARPMTEEELMGHCHWTLELEGGERVTEKRPPWNVPQVDTEGLTEEQGYWQWADGRRIVRHHGWTAFCGNFNGWVQYRKTIPGESNVLGSIQT